MQLEDLVTIHRPIPARDRHIAVFYLHGGGLLYGERDDLPQPYIRQLTDAGYTLICADYPLAPESTLPQIAEAVFDTWRSVVADPLAMGKYDGYFLFGRSAGAYLSLLLARTITLRAGDGLPQPMGILDFYGYHTLADAAFFQPAKAYARLPEVKHSQVGKLTDGGSRMVTTGPKALRYALYVHARQHEGAWLDLMGLDGTDPSLTREAWSLTEEEVAHLPPLFITASSADEDVPFRLSKTLSHKARRAVMKPVYHLPHDFDRDVSDPTGMQIYTQAIEWMDGLCPRLAR